MKVRVEKNWPTNKKIKCQQAKKIDCGRMMVDIG
jgi:hypothetical protein